MHENDVRFEVHVNPEPDFPDSTHTLVMFDLKTGEELESHRTGDPYGFIEAFREAQMFEAEGYDQQQRIEFYEARGIEGI